MIFISSYVMHITNLKWVTLCCHHHLFHANSHHEVSYLCMHIHDNVCYCVCERESKRVRVNENCMICLQGNGSKSEFIGARRRVEVVWECMKHDAILTNRLGRVILVFWIFFLIYKNYFKFIYYFKLSFKFQQ